MIEIQDNEPSAAELAETDAEVAAASRNRTFQFDAVNTDPWVVAI